VFQLISTLIKDLWAKNKGALLVIFLAGAVLYFIPLFQKHSDDAQAELLRVKTEEAQYWRTQTEIERHRGDSLTQVILVSGQKSVQELKAKQEKLDALNQKYGDALIQTSKVKKTIETTINKVDNVK
jgi:hypothetical protein